MDSGQLDWSEAFAAVRRGRAFILLSAAAVAMVAVFASLQVPVTERVTSRLIVSPTTDGEAEFNIADTVRVLTQPGVIGTLTQIIENPRGLEQAADATGISPGELADYEVVAQEVAGSLVLEIHVEGPDPMIAEQLATVVVTDATALFDELYPVYEVRVLDPPRPLGEPIQPSAIQFGVLGALVGAAGAALLVIGWSRMSTPSRPQNRAQGPARRSPAGMSATPAGERHPGSPEAMWPQVPPPTEPPASRDEPLRTTDRR